MEVSPTVRNSQLDSDSDDGDDVEQDYEPVSPSNARKRPASVFDLFAMEDLDPDNDDELEPTVLVPDLHTYLNQFNLLPKEKIQLCRSYASYLSAQSTSTLKRQ